MYINVFPLKQERLMRTNINDFTIKYSSIKGLKRNSYFLGCFGQ